MKKKLSKKKQIAILQEAHTKLLSDYKSNKAMGGLCCYLFGDAQYIPLFNRTNAVNFANGIPIPRNVEKYSPYWWEYNNMDRAKYDIQNRILFLEWIINKLSEKQSIWERLKNFLQRNK